jgi:alpha-beta hydrolase superfamily lysophospholipase
LGNTVEDKNAGIMYEEWKCPRPRAVLLLVHGLGAHTGRWSFLADFFLSRGVSSYAIMLKGFGKTPGPRGHVDSFNTYVQDVRALFELIKEENPNVKVFLLGESMGGLIAFIAAALYPDLFDGLACISPAFGNKMKFPFLEFLSIFLMYFFNNKKQFPLPFTSGMCTRDEEYIKVMDRDSGEIRTASAKLLVDIFFAELRAHKLSERIKKPVLFLLAGDDMLVDTKESARVFYMLKTSDKTLKYYRRMRHALSIDLDREEVFEDIHKWIGAET